MPVLSEQDQLPGKLDLTVYHGGTFSLNLTWTDDSGSPVNLTGYSADMKIVRNDGTLMVECSTANGMITLGGSFGTISVTIPATTTATFNPGNGQYDLMLTSGTGVVYPVLAGAVTIRASVTVS